MGETHGQHQPHRTPRSECQPTSRALILEGKLILEQRINTTVTRTHLGGASLVNFFGGHPHSLGVPQTDPSEQAVQAVPALP